MTGDLVIGLAVIAAVLVLMAGVDIAIRGARVTRLARWLRLDVDEDDQ